MGNINDNSFSWPIRDAATKLQPPHECEEETTFESGWPSEFSKVK